MGAPAAFRDHVQATRPETDFEVLQANAASMEVFLRMATQWTVGPMGGSTGMNYASLRWILELTADPARHARIFDDLQVMEAAVLEVVNARAAA